MDALTKNYRTAPVIDQGGLLLLETILQDIRFALRGLRRNPGYAFTAVLTLAVGIGATTAIFSAAYALLIKPLPYREPDRLIWVTEHWPQATGSGAILQPDMIAWRERGRPFESVAGYAFGEQTLTGSGDAVRVAVAPVTASFLSVLGIVPQIGQDFVAGDDHPKGPAVALLSDSLWRGRFSADPGIVGRVIDLDQEAYTVIGVLPPSFRFPDLTTDPQILVTLRASPSSVINMQAPLILFHAIGRIPRGQSLARVQSELQSVQDVRLSLYPPPIARMAEGGKVELVPLQRHLAGDSRTPVLVLLAAVGFVLLIASANIANLQLVRMAARRHEIAVRGALGAARSRLARQFLTESIVVAGFAAISGLIIAEVGIRALRGWHSSELPWLASVGLNLYVFGFSMVVSLAAAVLFGMAPAITGSRANLGTALKASSATMSGIRDHRLLRNGFVVAEIALALVLLIGAGLLVRSFRGLMAVNPGYNPYNVLTANVQLPPIKKPSNSFQQVPAPDYSGTLAFAEDLLPRLRALPGVRHAALTDALPLIHGNHAITVVWFGATPPPPEEWRQFTVPLISITPEFFHAMGTTIIQGRPFSEDDNDTALGVAIVNQEFARRFLSGGALGARFHSMAPEHCSGCKADGATELRVVGVVTDVHQQGLEQPVRPEIYLPFAQSPPAGLAIVLATNGPPSGLSASLRSSVFALNRAVPVYDIATLEERLSESLASRRLVMLLFSAFAILALLLAALGVYGVISYAVLQRQREIGIRVALGATRGRVLLLILQQQVRLILLGAIAGLGLGSALTGIMSSLLFVVKPHDLMTFVLSSVTMILVAILGSTAPALHAMRADPSTALRHE